MGRFLRVADLLGRDAMCQGEGYRAFLGRFQSDRPPMVVDSYHAGTAVASTIAITATCINQRLDLITPVWQAYCSGTVTIMPFRPPTDRSSRSAGLFHKMELTRGLGWIAELSLLRRNRPRAGGPRLTTLLLATGRSWRTVRRVREC